MADIESDIFIETIIVCVLSAEESEGADKLPLPDISNYGVDTKEVIKSLVEDEVGKCEAEVNLETEYPQLEQMMRTAANQIEEHSKGLKSSVGI